MRLQVLFDFCLFRLGSLKRSGISEVRRIISSFQSFMHTVLVKEVQTPPKKQRLYSVSVINRRLVVTFKASPSTESNSVMRFCLFLSLSECLIVLLFTVKCKQSRLQREDREPGSDTARQRSRLRGAWSVLTYGKTTFSKQRRFH